MIANNFNYTGKVCIEVTRNGHLMKREYANSGTDNLFQMFAYALAGRDISMMIPAYFTLSRANETSISLPIVKIYYPEVKYTSIPTAQKNICRLQCNLPLAKIYHLTNGTETNDNYELKIKSYENIELAHIDISGDTFNGLSESDQVIIVWDLFVTNGGIYTQAEVNEKGGQ